MDNLFKKFISNIMLSGAQKEDAQKKYNGVSETLHDHYYPNIKYNGSTKLLIGSYGKLTNIRPPRDIDLIFKMPEEEFERIDNLSGNKQSQLLQEIRSILKDTYSTTDKISAFGKVVVVNFSDGTHSVELLPGWETSGEKFKIPNSENGGSWEIFDPIAEMNYISISNQKTGRTYEFIRILKKWCENCSVPLKSFIVEVLSVQYLNNLDITKLQESYSAMVSEFFDYLIGKANNSLNLPSGKNIFLGDEWLSRTESARERAIKALEYEDSAKMEEAAEEWKKVFGDDFPKSEKSTSGYLIRTEQIMGLEKLYPSTKEQYLNQDYNIDFRLIPSYQVSIDAEVTQNGFRTHSLSHFIKNRWFLQKKKKLLFKVVKNNVPYPYEIMWKVRNFGEEAKDSDDLRGEISHGLGESKIEHTKYLGEHYVECYVVKDGMCVATDRIMVPINDN